MGAWRFSRWLLTLSLTLMALVAITLMTTAYLGAREALREGARQQHDQQQRILDRVVADRFERIRRYSRSVAETPVLVRAVEAGRVERAEEIVRRRLADGHAERIDALVVEGRRLEEAVGASLRGPTALLERLSRSPTVSDTWVSLDARWEGRRHSLLSLTLPIVEPSLGRVVGRLHAYVVLDDGFWITDELQDLFGARLTTLSHDGRLLDVRSAVSDLSLSATARQAAAAPIAFTPHGVLHGHALEVGDSDTYRLGLLLPDDGLMALRDTYALALICATLLVLAVGVGLMLLLRRRTVRSLEQLVRYAEEVPESGTPLPFRGGRFEEFNRVGKAIESMLARIRERDKYLEGIIRHAPDLIFVKDLEDRYRLVNAHYAGALRTTPSALTGQRGLERLDDATRGQAEAMDRHLLETGGSVQRHLPFETPDGLRHFRLTKFPIRDDRGRIYLIGGVATDVTDLRQTQEQLLLSRQVFAEASEGIVVLDAQRRVLLANRAFADMSGLPPAHATAAVRGFLLHHPEVARAMDEGRRWRDQCLLEPHEGEALPVLASAAPLPSAEDGPRYMLRFSDISSLKVAEQRLERLAWYDALTGLANRSLFTLELDEALQGEAPVAVLFIDLDRFKDVNDRYGHTVGDELLRQAARRLRSCVQGRDTVARFGGDEFSVLLRGIGQEGPAMAVARRIIDALGEPYDLGVARGFSNASVGVVLAGPHGGASETLIRNADQAMYEAKAHGRQQAVLFEAAIDERHRARLQLEAGLRQALANGELHVHYQPRYDIAGRRVVGAEALLRWQSPVHGAVPPSTFIPLAEQSGQIVALGAFVLAEACREAAGWGEGGDGVPVSVNLSPRQLHAPELIRDIHVALERSGLPPQMLELEITETFVMDNIDQVLPVLHQIRAMGVRLAVDDFGTGYSSLTYLKRLPVELLKIDRSFLADVPGQADDETLLTAIIDMAHALGFRVLAEGVETEAQRRFLAARGCDELQGFLLGRPLPPERLRERLAGGLDAR